MITIRCFDWRLVISVIVITVTCSAVPMSDDPVDKLGSAEWNESQAKESAKLWQGESYAHSLDFYSKAGSEWITLGEVTRAISCFREAARISVISNQRVQAIAILEKTFKIADQTNLTPEKIQISSQLAVLYLRNNDNAKSNYWIQLAKTLANTTENPSALGEINSALGDIAYSHNEIQSSVESYLMAYEAFVLAHDLHSQAEVLLSLAYSYLSLSDYKLGLKKAEESYKVAQEINDVRAQTLARVAIGQMKFRVDSNREALDYFIQAESVFPKDVDLLERAILYNGIASIYQAYGTWPLSQTYRLKAFELYEKEGNSYAQLATLPSLGKASYRSGDKAAALIYFNKGLDLAEHLHDKLFPYVIFDELGEMYLLENDFDKAEAYLIRASKGLNQAGFRRSSIKTETKLGKLNLLKGKLQTARRHFENVLKFSRELRIRFSESDALYGLALVEDTENHPTSSLTDLSDSLRITESLYGEIANKKLQTSFLHSISDQYSLLIRLLVKDRTESNGAITGLLASERSRARTMLESLISSDANFTADADPTIVQKETDLRGSLNAKSDTLTDLLSRNVEKTDTEKIGNEITDLENQLEEIKAELKQKSPIYSAIKDPEPFDVTGFQANVLDDKSTLIEFSMGKEESYLWVVDTTAVDAYVLPSRDAIEERVERLRAILKSREIRPGESTEEYQKRITDGEAEYRVEAHALSDEILGQAADKIAGKRLIVVSDGKLQYFPLGSLPMPNAESDDPILLTQEVVYEPSASALKLIKTIGASKTEPKKDLLVFADPVFSKDDDRLTGLDTTKTDLASAFLGLFRSGESIDKLPRLPASNEEAQAISNVVGASRSSVRSGFDANRDAVLNSDITDYKILHFATHGLMNETRPELSGILLSLFGRDGTKNDGGFIRLQDVYGMNLNADLVVLSACDTGVGKEVKGEGLMSLNNAFLQAGAKSVVSSLWKVDDDATKELMTGFYEGLANDNLTTSAALRQAQIKMYNDPRFHSPFYWASFTVEGDYSNPPRLGGDFDKRLLFLGILPLLIAVYLLKRRRA